MKTRKLIEYGKRFYYFLCGKILIARKYDRKYLTGKWFSDSHHGMFAVGWQWVVCDYMSCRRNGVNIGSMWPVSARNTVVHPENIHFHPDDLNNFQGHGCYFQGIGTICIGRGTFIAPNVGIITANHDFADLTKHLDPKPVIIGENCWLGMNSIILPGVELGERTIVGAGSVVTRSFVEGHCVIAGNPARFIKSISGNDVN